VDDPSLEAYKVRLDGAMGSLIQSDATFPVAGGLELDDVTGGLELDDH